MSPSQITTFYSYKGGVGRSMALANVATLLAEQGYRVLVVDFDLDAPGLHKYFLRHDSRFAETRYAPRARRAGVIELFCELRNRLNDAFPTAGDYDADDVQAIAKCRQIVDEVVEEHPGYDVRVGKQVATLHLLPAGSFDENYQERIREFDWQVFFEDFKEAFEYLRVVWKRKYDYVLIDSRTGLTDIGSVTTVILPDRLVVVFSPNEQSLHGALELARQSIRMRHEIWSDTLMVFPLLARIEPAEAEQRSQWIRRAARRFAEFFQTEYGWKDLELDRYFEQVHVPHSAYYAYGERIAVEEDVESGLGSLVEAYSRFLEVLQLGSIAEWQARIPALSQIPRDRTLILGFDATFDPPTRFVLESTIHVPEASTEAWKALRDVPANAEEWRRAARLIHDGVAKAVKGLRGSLHVFVMAPYPAAVLLGRYLDALARAMPIHLYQLNPAMGDWMLFSAPMTKVPPLDAPPFFREPITVTTHLSSRHIILAIEGTREIAFDGLSRLATHVDAGLIVRLCQVEARPLGSIAEARGAVAALRRVLEKLQLRYPAATYHVVTTAPIALLVELGRILSPTVYPSVIIYQYHPHTATYFPIIDIQAPEAQ